MATAALFLGERVTPFLVEREDPAPPPLAARRGQTARTLTSLAAALECGEIEVVDGEALPVELRSRVALMTLRRRAEKRGRIPVLRCANRDLLTLAKTAGWSVERSEAARSVDPGRLGVRGRESFAVPLLPQLALPALPSLGAIRSIPALPRVPRLSLRRAPAVCGALAASIALGVVLYPNASITVVPTTEPWQVELPIVVDPSAKKADVATGRLPGRTIMREATETAVAPATGKKTVPDGRASGEVVLLNRSETAVNVPKGTVVLAGAVKFAVQSDTTVAPSRRAGTAQSFGMATVKVQAVTGGVAGNVERNKIDRLEGPLNSSLSVQNAAALRGGSERQTTYVTEDDRRRVQETLLRSMADKLMQQVKKELPASDKETLVAWSGQNPAVVEAVFNKAADEEAQSVTLSLKVRYGATVFANEAYNQLVKQLAQAKAGDLRPGAVIAKESVQAEPPTVAAIDNGTVKLIGRARANVTSAIDADTLRQKTAGKPVAAARETLGELTGLAGYELSVNNVFPGRMPALGWRISVRSRPAA